MLSYAGTAALVATWRAASRANKSCVASNESRIALNISTRRATSLQTPGSPYRAFSLPPFPARLASRIGVSQDSACEYLPFPSALPPYLRRTNLLPSPLQVRVSPKAKPELEATEVRGWYGEGTTHVWPMCGSFVGLEYGYFVFYGLKIEPFLQ